MNKSIAAEAPEDELTGSSAFDAFHNGLIALTTDAGVKLEVRDFNIRRFNTKAIVFVKFTTGQSVTLRIALDRVRQLRDLLSTVVDVPPSGTEATPAARRRC